ncbi:MAG: hypothetical protein P1P84_00770 [Deferrisomatales bacterium]|nr:hypothetical protein [Deferrisomatales bacterium]
MTAGPTGDPRLIPLGAERLRVEWGPVGLVLSARWPGGTRREGLDAAGRRALEVLEELAGMRRLLTVDVRRIRNTDALPSAVRAAADASRPYAEEGVTPLIAVAGVVADAVADALAAQGATWAVVSNGGDVAQRLVPGESVTVGLVPRVDARQPAARVRVAAADGVGGVATSGFGGRSFTLGIADAATVFGDRAAAADVAATLAGNAVNVDSPAVERVLAESLDPDTDLRGRRVTRRVGALSGGEIEHALDRGAAWAEAQVEAGRIRGAVLTLGGRWRFVGWPGEGGVEWLEEKQVFQKEEKPWKFARS